MKPAVQGFFDAMTGTVSYVVYEMVGEACIVIDPVLDYDPRSGCIKTASADKVIDFVRENGLKIEWILETHVHADHISAASYLRKKLGGRIAIGAPIASVQKIFKAYFNIEPEFQPDGAQFDRLLQGGEMIFFGAQSVIVLSVPGHTPACMAYEIGDAIFVGDTLFMPDLGTARCDFPGGSALQLYHSISKILSAPPTTRLYMCHDYPPSGRNPAWETTVSEQRARNIHIKDGITQEEFVKIRTERDVTLQMPALIFPSVQMNIRAGEMPPKESNGVSYLKVPLNSQLPVSSASA